MGGFCFHCRMIDIARKLDKAEREALLRAAYFLKKMEQYAYAAEIYTKLGDQKMLVHLHVDARHWEDVSKQTHPFSPCNSPT